MPLPAPSRLSDSSPPVTLTYSGILSVGVYPVPLSAKVLAAEVSGAGSEPLKPDIMNMYHF